MSLFDVCDMSFFNLFYWVYFGVIVFAMLQAKFSIWHNKKLSWTELYVFQKITIKYNYGLLQYI